MTCHIGLLGPSCGVLLSDSQASSDSAESHGTQKQLAGPGFLLAGAGHGGVIGELFADLWDGVQRGEVGDAESATAAVLAFLHDECTAAARECVEFLMVRAGATGEVATATLCPSTFVRWRRQSGLVCSGSGQEFVYRAAGREAALGVELPLEHLGDAFLRALDLGAIANESLTVDDVHLVGLLVGGQTYLLGDPRIALEFALPKVRACWPQLSQRFAGLRGLAETIRGELLNQQRQFSMIRATGLPVDRYRGLVSSALEIERGRAELNLALAEYIRAYDELLRGR